MRVSAPNFEQLERLNGTRDADLIARRYVDPTLNRGRGAQTNKGSRFDRQSREEFDDGWGQVEDLKPFETIEHVERARTIITRNDLPLTDDPHSGGVTGTSRQRYLLINPATTVTSP